DEVLGLLRGMTREHKLTVLMITHKFREVMAYADAVTVLRGGRFAGSGPVAELDTARMAEMMVGERAIPQAKGARSDGIAEAEARLSIERLEIRDDSDLPAVRDFSLQVRPGEIVGVAGVSGNGQKELIEALIGQRAHAAGQIRIGGKPFAA